jgi:hypothetical protein
MSAQEYKTIFVTDRPVQRAAVIKKIMDRGGRGDAGVPTDFSVKPERESNPTNAFLKINPYNISHTAVRFL